MKSTPTYLFSLVALPLLLAGGRARADYMDWSYHWSISPGPVLASGTGNVALALFRDGPGAATIPAATVSTNSAATAAAPDRYNVGYALTLRLTDNPSHQSGDLTFHGTVAGTVTAASSQLTNTFSDPLTQKLALAGHLYSVTVTPTLLTLPAPNAPPPQISAQVSVGGVQGPPPPLAPPPPTPPPSPPAPAVQNSPEPSALALGGLALGAAALAGWWRKARGGVAAPGTA